MMHSHICLIQTHTSSVEFTYSSKWNIARLAILITFINYWFQLQPKEALLKKKKKVLSSFEKIMLTFRQLGSSRRAT